MTEPQFHAIIALMFLLYLPQSMMLAAIMRRLKSIEKVLEEMG